MLSLRLSAVLLVLPLMPLWGQNAEPGLAELEALTPVGAKRDGNAAGTIPAWTGGLTEAPANYSPQFHETDPFADDQPLFTIDAGNAAKYADNLSPGQRALLEQYPETWRLHVYPSRRTAAYPQFVYDALAANAGSAQLITEGRGGVNGSDITSPFPQPENGLEVIWNHNLRWRGIRVQRSQGTAAVTRAGNFTLVLSRKRSSTSHKPTTSTDPEAEIVPRFRPPRPPTPMNATFMRSLAAE